MARTRAYHHILNKGLRTKIASASDELFLAKLLTNNRYTRHVFRGTFAINDLVKKPIKLPAAYIYNTNPRSVTTIGHWIGVYAFNKNNRTSVEIFGSYGLKPPNQLLRTVRTWSRDIVWNRCWYQNYKSPVCGMYAVYFIHYICLGWSMEEIHSHFTKNSLANDELVSDLVYSTTE